MYISKRLGTDHSFTCKYAMPAFLHMSSPDGATPTKVRDIQLQLTTHLSSAVRFWIFISRFGFGSICRINRGFGFGFTLLDPSMNDVINGVTPLTIRRN